MTLVIRPRTSRFRVVLVEESAVSMVLVVHGAETLEINPAMDVVALHTCFRFSPLLC